VLFEPRKTFEVTRKEQGADRQKEQPLENRKNKASSAEYEKDDTQGNAYETLHYVLSDWLILWFRSCAGAPVPDRLRKNV
jgi:hypothetical protein